MEIPDAVQFVHCTVDSDEFFLNGGSGDHAPGTVLPRIDRLAATDETALDIQIFVGTAG